MNWFTAKAHLSSMTDNLKSFEYESLKLFTGNASPLWSLVLMSCVIPFRKELDKLCQEWVGIP